MKKRIGIMGGTFDPIHNGHLKVAKEIKEYLDISTIYLMPNFIPPHKKPAIASDIDRLAMVDIACQELDNFKCLDEEIKKGNTSYLYQTLQTLRLKQEFKDADLYFIMGMDSLLTFHNWKNPEEILKKTNIAVASRPSYNINNCDESIVKKIINKKEILDGYNGQIVLCPTSEIDISSTQIRKQNLSFIKTQVPTQIFKYIMEHHLYYDKG